MLSTKLNKHFIAFNQVGHHGNPIIVAINIHLTHNCIGFICWENILYHQIFAEQKNCSRIEAIGIVYIVTAD